MILFLCGMEFCTRKVNTIFVAKFEIINNIPFLKPGKKNHLFLKKIPLHSGIKSHFTGIDLQLFIIININKKINIFGYLQFTIGINIKTTG